MTVIGYARVSTGDQTTALQIDALRSAGVQRIFTEVASGANQDRAELARMLSEAREGDVIVVWRLDRLGRSTTHLLRIVEDLRARGVGFRSLTEGMSTDSAGGMLIYSIFAAIAAFERDLLRERTCAGIEAAKKRGRVGGRPSVMTPERVQAAEAMLREGATMTAVQTALGVSRSALYAWARARRDRGV